MPDVKRPSETDPSRRAMLAGTAAMALLPVRAAAESPKSEPDARRLVAGPARASLKPGKETALWSFDGSAQPPVIRVKHGEQVRVRVENKTEKPIALHWHGVRIVNAMDGVGGLTQPPIQPGADFIYAFTPPDSGTSVARTLVVGGSSEPSGRGLAGMLVVEERSPPPVDHDLTLLMQDWRLEEDGALLTFGQTVFAASSGRLGNLISVNGKAIPETIEVRPGARVRLRLGNACNARNTSIRFDGAKAYVAAVDGQPVDTFEPLRATLPFAPGTRYDIMLDMLPEANARVTVNALTGKGLVLATLVTKGDPVKEKKPQIGPIGDNPLLPPEIRLQNAMRRDIVITGGAAYDKAKPEAEPSYSGDPAAIWKINGKSGAPEGPPLFSVKRGQVVVLAIKNDTDFLQALHVHGHVFRLLHPLDDGWEPYWLDTMQITERRIARIAFLADNPGRWPISAAVLERFDTGLWGTFEVT